LPFEHTTVVVLPGGTTTVVFCGAGGLELLMHPDNITAAAIIALSNTFIVSTPVLSIPARSVTGRRAPRQGCTPQQLVVVLLQRAAIQ
jgi:hypothetical protein